MQIDDKIISLLKAFLCEGDCAKNTQQEATLEEPSFPIGKPFCIRTVTHIVTGNLLAVSEREFTLIDAAWIADTGRFSEFAATGKVTGSGEVEPYLDGRKIYVGRGALIDAFAIDELPRILK